MARRTKGMSGTRMARTPSKNTGSGRRVDQKVIGADARRAQSELARLLKRSEEGSITRKDLHLGLKETQELLRKIPVHYNANPR